MDLATTWSFAHQDLTASSLSGGDTEVSVRGPGSPGNVDRSSFRWLLPGERPVAVWALGRVQKVQGNSRQLLAGAYIILAALWGTLGGTVGLVFGVLEFTNVHGPVIPGLFVAALALWGIAIVRQIQARRARSLDQDQPR